MSLGCSKDEHFFLLRDPMPDRVNGIISSVNFTVYWLFIYFSSTFHLFLNEWPKMNRDTQQKGSPFLKKKTAFLLGISLHFRPFVVRYGFSFWTKNLCTGPCCGGVACARLSLHGYFCPRKYVGNGELLVQMYLGKWDNCLLLLCSRLNLWHYYYGYG